jgi:sialic acid synthase SpsE
MGSFTVNGKAIGKDSPTYFIADIAANHDGSLHRAKELIRLAAEAGADAAKFQNFKAEKIVSDVGFSNLGASLGHQTAWKKSVFEVYQDASLPGDWTPELRDACEQAGIEYFSSPYDRESVDLLDPYVRMYKIGSGDITWLEIIEYIARKNKPVLIATGASSLADVQRAMDALTPLCRDVVLMQCNTNYTGSRENFRCVNLNVLRTFGRIYPNAVLGFSDHTPGHAAVLGAVALGARVVEKHFTDDTGRAGPDHRFSMTPAAWRDMVERVRELEAALGDGVKRVEENERNTAIIQRRALRAVRGLPEGHVLARADVEALRPIPEDGLPPHALAELLGQKLSRPIARGEHLTRGHF